MFLFVFAGLDCHKSIIYPPPTSCEFPPGNRVFTWRTDTVAWWPSEVGGVWAFSDTDAYVMGNISGPTVPGQKHYPGLHWNGKVWDTTLSWDDSINSYANDVAGDDHFLVTAGYWDIGDEHAGVNEFDNRTKKWTGYQFQTPGRLYSVWTDGDGYYIAVGDNGTVYTKDGYTASWVYSKAPTGFDLVRITGVSRSEMYAAGVHDLVTGQEYDQYWKFDGRQWYKVFDNQDTTGNVIKLTGDYSAMLDIAAYRCTVTDSLELYLVGTNSFLLQSRGQSLNYSVVDLSGLGLPLHDMSRTSYIVNLFTPNDIWILGSGFNYYQWNGANFQQVVIPGLPPPGTMLGYRNMIKTKSGKVFFPTQVAPWVYVVAQGTP